MFGLLVEARQWRQSLNMNLIAAANKMETEEKFEGMCQEATGDHKLSAESSCCQVCIISHTMWLWSHAGAPTKPLALSKNRHGLLRVL